jgi:DNA topoisomerase-1
MEEELDEIEADKKNFSTVIHDFYSPFSDALDAAKSKKETIRESLIKDTQEKCPTCGKSLIERWGRNGKFIGCSGYPDCRYTKPLEGEEVATEEVCEKCGKPMVVKIGRFGRFLACSGYPACKNNKPFSLGIGCPKDACDGKIVERKTRGGKTFYGCSKYPSCDFASWYEPIAIACNNCGSPYLEQRYNKSIGNYLYCPKCKTKYEQSQKDE